MKTYEATELAYKNGYEKGKQDAVKHGRWIDKGTCYVCSLCSRVERLQEPYCHCGAKMDGEEKENGKP